MSKEEILQILSSLTPEQLDIIENLIAKLNAHSQKIGYYIKIMPCSIS